MTCKIGSDSGHRYFNEIWANTSGREAGPEMSNGMRRNALASDFAKTVADPEGFRWFARPPSSPQ